MRSVMDMEADAELAARVTGGDEAAMAELVERYQPLVQSVVFHLLDDARDREEVCQDALVRAIRHIGAWRGDARLRTWIARIAHRAALQRLRLRRLPLIDDTVLPEGAERDAAANRVADEGPDAHEMLEQHGRAEHVREAVRRLPPLYRSAVTLYYLQELSVGEVAEAMDIPAGTVKSYLFRARRQLREHLRGATQ